MHWLNYHHLYYFWLVARDGSISRAAEQLQLAHPTISKQIHQLETSFDEKLFDRVGRNLVLTEFGQTVFRYAEQIFAVGRELQDTVREWPSDRRLRFAVGMTDVMPKLITHELLKPAFELTDNVQVVCHEGRHDDMIAELAVHRLDLVLSNASVSPTVHVRVYNHLLGECGLTFFAKAGLAAKYRRNFPSSLDRAPLLVPTEKTVLRRDLEQWFDNEDIRPKIIGEFEDSALMKVFGQDGMGLFPASTVIEKEVCHQYSVKVVGRIDAVRERYYAISVERRLKHPAIIAIRESARTKLFE